MDAHPASQLLAWTSARGAGANGDAQTIGIAVVLGSLRGVGLLVIFPLFSFVSLQGIVRYVLAVALSAPVVQSAYVALAVAPPTGLALFGLAAKELVLGGVLGAVFGAPFWAVSASGDMTDVYRGANAANQFDPINALETTTLGSFFLGIALAVFVASGGMLDLFSAFLDSFSFWPLLSPFPVFSDGARAALFGLIEVTERSGLTLAAPLLLTMFAAEFSVSYVTRSAKKLGLQTVQPLIKTLALWAALGVYGIFATSYYQLTTKQAFEQGMRVIFGGRDGGR